MPTYTLADLRTPQTADVIQARLLTALGGRGLPVADWAPASSGGPEMTVVGMIAGTIASLVGAKAAALVSARFLDFATGDFLAYLAQHFYGLTKIAATFTIQNITLTSAAAAAPEQFQPGDLWVKADSGNRYQSLDAVNLVAGGSIQGIRFQAEFPGASYSDVAGTIRTMVTAPGGVSCVNEAPSTFLDSTQIGSSTGTVEAQPTGSPPAYQSIRVRIDASGEVGVAIFSWTIDDGVTWHPAGTVRPVFTGIPSAALFFGEGSTPSFIQGEIFTILVGQAIAQQGADDETDDSLRDRCRCRWPTLSDVPTSGTIRLWARLASPEVSKVIADADPSTPGQTVVTIASQAGPASAQAQIAVTDYITPRLQGFQGVPASPVAGSPEERVLVRSAATNIITPAGLVSVPRAKVPAVQQAADNTWDAYLRGVLIGGIVHILALEQAIMDAGAINVGGLTLNGNAANVQLATGSGSTIPEVAVPSGSLVNALTWKPV